MTRKKVLEIEIAITLMFYGLIGSSIRPKIFIR